MEHPAALTKDEIVDAVFQTNDSLDKAIAHAQLAKAVEWAATEIESMTVARWETQLMRLVGQRLRDSLTMPWSKSKSTSS